MREYYNLAPNNNLKKIRKQKGMPQRALAMACHQSDAEISRYEHGNCMPSYTVLFSIAKFLEVPMEEIYPGLREIHQNTESHTNAMREYWIKRLKQ